MEHQNAEYYKVILGRTDYLNMASVQLMHTISVFFHVPFISPTFAVFCFFRNVYHSFDCTDDFQDIPTISANAQAIHAALVCLGLFMEATILIQQRTDGYGRYSFPNHGDPSCTQSIYYHP